jgi:hypothetical protein
MARLSGAAATAHTRRRLLDLARQAITRRDPNAVADVVLLLEQADANTLRRKAAEPTVVTYTGHGLGHGTYREDVAL